MNDRALEKVLIVRTDRIGDVLLTLPMIPALQARFPGVKVSMLLREYTLDLARGFPGIDQLISEDDSRGKKSFLRSVAEVQSQKFDLVVAAYPTFRIALLTFLAGIPLRVGSGYRWYSLLFNRKVFEHRRRGEKHEAEYNLSLLQAVGCRELKAPEVRLTISEQAKHGADAELTRLGIRSTDKFVILHPGSGGSARDWSPSKFGKLGRALMTDGYRVVITGLSSERDLVDRVRENAGDGAEVSVGRLSLKELAAFIGNARLLVSNSTGPLHIAAAMGIPVIGLYPPIPECSPRRWGPLTEKKVVFTADNNACPRCKGGPCQGNDCMDQIAVDDVLKAARMLIESSQNEGRS